MGANPLLFSSAARMTPEFGALLFACSRTESIRP